MPREMPFNEEAEKAALAAMIMEPTRLVPHAVNVLKIGADAFHLLPHQLICKALFELSGKQLAGVDIVTIAELLKTSGDLDRVGGTAYIDTLIDALPSAAHGEYYLEIVRSKFILRQTIEVCKEVALEAYTVESGEEMLQTVPPRFIEIIDKTVHTVSDAEVMGEIITEFEDVLGTEKGWSGLPWPWENVNVLTGGIENGTTILAARTSQGKTSVEGQVALYNGLRGNGVGRITLDMNRRRLLKRSLALQGGVSLAKLQAGFAGKKNLDSVREAAAVLEKLPIYISDSNRDLRSICTWVRAEKMRHDIKMVTIDYVQQITVSHGTRWDQNRIVGYVSQTLKALMLELGMPLILLSQLKRFGDKDRPPVLTDLRDSGTLEQDANKVIFLHKDVKAAEELENKSRRPMWFECAKNQDGAIGSLEFWFRPPYFRYDPANENWANDRPPETEGDEGQPVAAAVEPGMEWAEDFGGM